MPIVALHDDHLAAELRQTGASTRTFSTSIISAVQVIGLVIEAIQNTQSVPVAVLAAMSIQPTASVSSTLFDAKPETWFNSNNTDGQYVGLDLEDQAATARPAITPGGGDFDQPQVVAMKCATPGAVIRYTLDGTLPTAQSGTVFAQPFTIERNAMITAVAFSDSLAPSPPALSTLWIGKQPHPPMNSFHVGNSLTGNASRFKTFIRTAGGAMTS
ncbi:MAG: hypothetical protein QOE70_3274 [Chthoniobacter sp.]|nr:hypothetical protein [Chthoniobacter sp.]